MKMFQGIFANDKVLILEFGMEFPWEGYIRGLTKEVGEHYYYIVEDMGGKVHYVPRDAIQRISRISRGRGRRQRGTKSPLNKNGTVLKLVR